MQKTFLYFVEGLLLHLSILFYLLGQINPSKLVIILLTLPCGKPIIADRY